MLKSAEQQPKGCSIRRADFKGKNVFEVERSKYVYGENIKKLNILKSKQVTKTKGQSIHQPNEPNL